MRLFRITLLTIFVLALTLAASAQTTGAINQAEMKKFDFMIGEWKGGGWIMLGPDQKHTFTGTETIKSRLDGTALVVEGLHKTKFPESDREVVIHNALGVVSYDTEVKKYRITAWLATGRHTVSDVIPIDSGWQWGFADPRAGNVRFTIKITDKGEWREVGEFSRDQKTWTQFFEMTLQRVK